MTTAMRSIVTKWLPNEEACQDAIEQLEKYGVGWKYEYEPGGDRVRVVRSTNEREGAQ